MRNFLKTDIVPWRNPDEFIKVYECAYSDDMNKNRWAIEKITVWETRCWPSLPTAVEATLLFLRSRFQDNLYEGNKKSFSAQEIEMMYSNAVVRFVNLLVENDQNSKSKKRIAYLAAERNIPSWIVDIRHSTTHGFHPTLPILRMAHETIMDYLEKIFWIPEKSRVCALKKTFDETPMIELIQDYRARQYQVVADNLKQKKDEINSEARDKILEKIDFLLSKPNSRRNFLNILARDFVTVDDINAMVSDDEAFMDINITPSTMSLPKPLKLFYYPLIKLIHKHDSISTLLELLLLGQEKRDLIILQKVVDYAVMFVLNLAKASVGEDKDCTIPFICKGANINMYRLLYSCVRGCSTTSRVVYERLVEELHLETFSRELSSIMNIRRGVSIPDVFRTKRDPRQKRKFDLTFNADEVESDILEVTEESNFRKRGPWNLAPRTTDWASIPIGHVFNHVDNTKKEEPKHEGDPSSVENNENMYAYAFEESKPIISPQPTNFIFNKCPNRSSMLYKRKCEEI